MKKFILTAFLVALSLVPAFSQNAAVMPMPKIQLSDSNGNPLAGGCVFSYQAGTSTPLATYTDSTGAFVNANPAILDAGGFGSIWLGSSLYKVVVKSAGGINCASGTQIYSVDNFSNTGLRALTQAVLLNPAGAANQTVNGPLSAKYFTGTTNHTTSPNVRVGLLDATTVLDSATHPPNLVTVDPAASAQNYRVPDPLGHGTFVMSPDPTQAGLNALDCTLAGLTCKRYAFVYFEGAGCNSATAGLGWDNFGANSPAAICLTGTNIQKGVLALPSAATKVQEGSGGALASGTDTLNYPAATTAGNFLGIWVLVNGGKTVSGVTDGTNAYTKAISKTNGNTDLEFWYFNGSSTGMAAATPLVVTLSGAADSVVDFVEYRDVKTVGALDASASNSATGTAVTTGTTAGTAQATELVLTAVGSPGLPSITFQSGTVPHVSLGNAAGTLATAGVIQQATAPQSGTFTLGSSQAWAAAVVTFKVNVAGPILAQRQFLLPPTYVATVPMNVPVKWQAPSNPTGTVNVKLGAQVVCTADGSSDDPFFLPETTATAAVNASAPNLVTNTPLNGLTTTGCTAGNLLHLQLLRHRYDLADTYDGYVYVNGVGLQLGVN